MEILVVLSIGITILSIVLSLAFKVAGKLRLGLPLLYFVVAAVSTFFTRWTSEHEQLVLWGLYILIGLVILSWVVTIVKKIKGVTGGRKTDRNLEDFTMLQINRAREMGIPLDNVRFDEDGMLLHPETGKPILGLMDT